MSFFDLFKRRNAAPVAATEPKKAAMLINQAMLALSGQANQKETVEFPKVYEPPVGVVPARHRKSAIKLAMDSMSVTPSGTIEMSSYGYGNVGQFPGYPYLAFLAQRAEYRKLVTTISEEMVRKWIEFRSTGDDDKSKKIEQLEQAFKKFGVRDVFKQAAEHDGYFGRGQIYLDVEKPGGGMAYDDPNELKTPLELDSKKIAKGGLKGIRTIEPVWTYAGMYQSIDPLRPDYFRPQIWYVMGKEVHASRLPMMISNPLPDLLKAAYNFGGLSMIQLAEAYVNNWLRTRDSVSDMIHSFSLSILKTDLSQLLAGIADPNVLSRADLFNRIRDNRGLMMVDKNMEEVEQINTPLGGLHELQAQSQEHMASVSGIPLVKLLGIQPAGLNASADGEIRVFYDTIKSRQEAIFRKTLKVVSEVIQLSEFGEIDPEIDFDFVPLYQLSEIEIAQRNLAEAQADQIYVAVGAVGPDEIRQKLSSDPESPYHAVEMTDDIESPEEEGDEGERSDTSDTAAGSR